MMPKDRLFTVCLGIRLLICTNVPGKDIQALIIRNINNMLGKYELRVISHRT